MEYQVVAEIEIDGTRIEHYTNVTLRQKFNAHHEFIISINHDVMEASGSFSLENAQKKIGKSALIRLQRLALTLEVAYEFRGIICEVRFEQTGNSNADLVLVGYSPTVLMENGQHLTSFYQADLKKIVQQVTRPLDQVNCTVNISPQYTKQVNYICQYRESSFHFLNRLSSEFSEFFYYDGEDLNFGKPATVKNIDVTYGEDVNSMQLTLQAQPMNFSNYSYLSKEDKVEKFDAPAGVEGLGQYARFLVKESNNLFAEPVNLPLRQRVENKADLENFVKKQKAALAANLEILRGRSTNPAISIGAIANVKVSKPDENAFISEDYGKFLITRIDHFLTENGKYYNSFEAIPANTEVIPVTNIIAPVAEPQIAIVKDNKDPDNAGRVRVQMLWQKGNEMTDWIRVMTPDAGGGKSGAKNRGLVVIPETGDQVLVSFRYNDPDRPLVMGSLFHGKSGGGGGKGNKTKSLTSLSGSTVRLDGDAISIIDATGENKIILGGNGKIDLVATDTLTLTCGDSSLELKSDGTITLTGAKDIILHAAENVRLTAESGDISLDALAADVVANSGAGIKLTGTSEFTAAAPTAKATVAGMTLSLSGTATAELNSVLVKIN